MELFSNSTFIGIDPTAGEKPFAYAALDQDLHLLALGTGSIDQVLAFTAGQRQAVVAVCSPRQPNQGVMAKREVRQSLSPMPSSGRWLNFRLADYLLRQHHITIPQTPSSDEDCPQWMRNGFVVYKRLAEFGYTLYPHDQSNRQMLEVYPHAAYAVLLGILPFPKTSLEGRIQRQLILHEQRLHLPDPMRIFEEITRHRFLKGRLALDDLLPAGELDALVGAYTAWKAVVHPDQVVILGDEDEGQIILPAALKETYNAGVNP
jgi:hypothetical protein